MSSSARFVFVVHHVATDGWSSAQLIRELSENYDAIVAGTDPPLRSDITYADFAEWRARKTPPQPPMSNIGANNSLARRVSNFRLTIRGPGFSLKPWCHA